MWLRHPVSFEPLPSEDLEKETTWRLLLAVNDAVFDVSANKRSVFYRKRCRSRVVANVGTMQFSVLFCGFFRTSMWVLIWDGKPSFWLLGGHSYTIGRKGTDIIISDDPSISRLHLTLHVGLQLGSKPATFRIVDSSKYGASLSVVDQVTALKPVITLSHDGTTEIECSEFIEVPGQKLVLNIGSHGAAFTIAWWPLPVYVLSGADRARGVAFEALQSVAQIVGVTFTDSMEAAWICLVDPDPLQAFMPSPAALSALCLAKPIVDKGYLDRIASRLTAKIPLPEPDVTFSLPAIIDSSWWDLIRLSSGSCDMDRGLFCPKKERSSIFRDCVFVCFQTALFDELNLYVPSGKGRVVCDPLEAEVTGDNFLHPWCARHQHHIVAVASSSLTANQARGLSVLRGFSLVIIEYADIVCSILQSTRHPSLNAPFPSVPPLEIAIGRLSEQYHEVSAEAFIPMGTLQARLIASQLPCYRSASDQPSCKRFQKQSIPLVTEYEPTEIVAPLVSEARRPIPAIDDDVVISAAMNLDHQLLPQAQSSKKRARPMTLVKSAPPAQRTPQPVSGGLGIFDVDNLY